MNNLQVRWIIESNVLSYTDNLVEYLEENNIYYKKTNYQEVISHNYDDKFGGLVDSEVATVFVGSLRLAKEINKYPISPGAIRTLDNFKCTNYYDSWSPYLLNKDWTLTMRAVLERDVTSRGKYFFRPNTGDKLFTGGLFTKLEMIECLKSNEIIVQANKKNIGDEYRFLVVDRKIIDVTEYKTTSNPYVCYYYEYMEEILAQDDNLFIPDRAFTVDIGVNLETSTFGVIELNSFSCANLYSMNMDKVVPAINDLAKSIYEEANIDW